MTSSQPTLDWVLDQIALVNQGEQGDRHGARLKKRKRARSEGDSPPCKRVQLHQTAPTIKRLPFTPPESRVIRRRRSESEPMESNKRPRRAEQEDSPPANEALTTPGLFTPVRTETPPVPSFRGSSFETQSQRTATPSYSFNASQVTSSSKDPLSIVTSRQRLQLNGVESVRWSQVPSALKACIDAILFPKDDTANRDSADPQEPAERTRIPPSDWRVAAEARAAKILEITEAEELSEMDLLTSVMVQAFPIVPLLQKVADHRFRPNLVPSLRPADHPPSMWPSISTPQADGLLGYVYNTQLVKMITILDGNNHALTEALLPAARLFCPQIAIEFKSSAKKGTITQGFSQNIGAMAALSRSLSRLIQSALPDQQATLSEDLKQCLVFGFVINETTAYTTALWKTNDADETYNYTRIDGFMLFDTEPMVAFLQRIDYLQNWMIKRRPSIIATVQSLRDRIMANVTA